MVIATCESKEEDAESQIIFWRQLNSVMQRLGYPQPEFADFMADKVVANWTAICTVYNGGPHNVLIRREHSCLFHWEPSLQKHTKKFFLARYRDKHIEMCENWRLLETEESANVQALAIQ